MVLGNGASTVSYSVNISSTVIDPCWLFAHDAQWPRPQDTPNPEELIRLVEQLECTTKPSRQPGP
ncbi:hypothetical protein ASPCADRAFT_209241 [Aspergillus carbonarius ITEM 5010]|uniref:Uncharacterized protein n=1 Tax=Aspergillus carbonarius (strain ITEM 5010) TaxID=602072 RepID=A0A1R3RHP0_ASPC5|nr:hypothetical protein ASPCADRAFT_209241 [Aspergillus carbonarius ITEM 5010]